MRVIVNGEPKDLAPGATLGDLIRALHLADAPCAAEVNKALVPRRQRDARPLAEGDRIEVVTLVGGG